MIVAGLDSGTTSGVGILDGRRLVHASSFRPKGDEDAEIFHGFRVWWWTMLMAHGAMFAAIEEPLRTDIKGGADVDAEFGEFASRPKASKPIGNMRTFLRLYGLRAQAIEVCHALNIPCVEVNVRTWRSAIYGPVGPPPTIASAKRSAWWKRKALDHCKVLKWDIKSKDAAEAALIADWRAATLNPELRRNDLFSRKDTAA